MNNQTLVQLAFVTAKVCISTYFPYPQAAPVFFAFLPFFAFSSPASLPTSRVVYNQLVLFPSQQYMLKLSATSPSLRMVIGVIMKSNNRYSKILNWVSNSFPLPDRLCFAQRLPQFDCGQNQAIMNYSDKVIAWKTTLLLIDQESRHQSRQLMTHNCRCIKTPRFNLYQTLSAFSTTSKSIVQVSILWSQAFGLCRQNKL